MEIKKFRCGLCKENVRYAMTRQALRKHLREEHRITSEIFNFRGNNKSVHKGNALTKKRDWVIEE